MAEKRAAYEYYVPPELRPLTRKVAPFVKGVNTGIAELAGFPVYLANLTPTLINLLPGKQGMKPFSEKPLGGAQTFKDLMAAGNIDTYKDLQSIPKDEYGAGVTGMLSGEALLSMFPVKRAVDALMAGKKGKKNTLPVPTAGGVDLSRRDLLKKAGAAAVATAVSPSILKEAGDIAGAAVKTAKVVPKGAIISRARDLASDLTNTMIKDLFMSSKERKRLGLPEKPNRTISDKKTVELNTLLEDFMKGKTYEDLMKLSKNDKAELYNLKQTSHHQIVKRDKSTGRDKKLEYGDSAGDPLRSKEYGPLLDKVFKDSGIGVFDGKYTNRIPNFGDPPPRNLLADPSAFNDAFGLNMFPSEKLIKKMVPQQTSLFPTEAKKGRQLLIVSCGSTKCPDVGNMKALDRYLGPIFQSIKKAGVPENVDVAILSAKHGLIRADTPIENYDQLMTKDKVKDFVSDPNEMSKIAETMQGYDNVLVQGGDNYKNVIKSAAGDTPFTEVPKGRGIGDQRSFVANFLKDQAKPIDKKDLVGGYNPVTGKIDEPQRFFHGTDQSFKEFDPKAKYTFVADDPETAEYYSGVSAMGEFDTGANIRPVYLKKANYFDVDNPKHIKMLRESDFFKKNKKDFPDQERIDEFLEEVEAGNYDTIEYPPINPSDDEQSLVDWIRSKGFDGFTTYEQSGKNFAVFDTKNIVPGVEKKAEGGIAGLSDVARDMFKGPKGIGAYQSFMVG